MQMDSTVVDDVTVVKMHGNLDTQTSPDALKELERLIDEGAGNILCDFGEVEYVSSAGLRVLLATAKKLGTSGGELRVCRMNSVVKDVFEISGFVTIIKIFETESEALKNFAV